MKEIFIPIKDFQQIESKNEKRIKLLFSVIFIIVNTIYIVFFIEKDNLKNFFEGFIDAEINITSLLLSFSIAYLTMLITSSGANIDILKNTLHKSIKINAERVSLFQVLLTELTFSIYLEIALLILLVINKYTVLQDVLWINMMLFLSEILLLLDILFILLRLVKNIYLSFWKNNV